MCIIWIFLPAMFASASLCFALVPIEGAAVLAPPSIKMESSAGVPSEEAEGVHPEGDISRPPALQEKAPASKGSSIPEADSEPSILAGEADGTLLARTLGGLGLVISLILVGYIVIRRFGPNYLRRPPEQRSLRIVETLPLGEKRSIALVQAGDQRLLIGNTASQITLLLQLPAVPDFADPAEQRSETKLATGAVTSFRRLYEVEKDTTARPPTRQIPPDLREKMRQLREALEK